MQARSDRQHRLTEVADSLMAEWLALREKSCSIASTSAVMVGNLSACCRAPSYIHLGETLCELCHQPCRTLGSPQTGRGGWAPHKRKEQQIHVRATRQPAVGREDERRAHWFDKLRRLDELVARCPEDIAPGTWRLWLLAWEIWLHPLVSDFQVAALIGHKIAPRFPWCGEGVRLWMGRARRVVIRRVISVHREQEVRNESRGHAGAHGP